MSITAGIDVGSTYTKAIVLDSENHILGRRLEPTGFKLDEVAENVLAQALAGWASYERLIFHAKLVDESPKGEGRPAALGGGL